MINISKRQIRNIGTLFILLVIFMIYKAVSQYPVLLYSLVILIIIIIVLNIYFKTPAGKGYLGERSVRKVIGKTKIEANKYIVNNLTFEIESRSVQIDHILLTKAGIFVIETKNYSGRIYGNKYDDYWTQVLAFGRSKHKVYSPIKQNYGHIKALEEVVGYKDFYTSIICFTSKAEIMNDLVDSIYKPKDLKSILKLDVERLTSNELEVIYNKLLELKKNNTVTKKKHIKNVNKIIEEKQSN